MIPTCCLNTHNLCLVSPLHPLGSLRLSLNRNYVLKLEVGDTHFGVRVSHFGGVDTPNEPNLPIFPRQNPKFHHPKSSVSPLSPPAYPSLTSQTPLLVVLHLALYHFFRRGVRLENPSDVCCISAKFASQGLSAVNQLFAFQSECAEGGAHWCGHGGHHSGGHHLDAHGRCC